MLNIIFIKIFQNYLPDVPLTNVMMGGNEMNVTNIVFTNGGEDPW